ncbi:MAG: ferrochelatase [Bdellovibrionales bacterium]|jgi:ferrochelatase|nr:ferrochelatase [Bdellovibrionales bacterium]
MTNQNRKTAIVLMNLGGPLKEQDIKPFLFNFFMDKNIIAAPLPVRWMLAKWISYSRGNGAAKTSYAALGGKSPLLENTQAQADALQNILQKKYPQSKVFVSMRYWHPMARDVVRAVKEFAPDNIILLPLYPQFSTTTSFSSIQNWEREAKLAGLDVPTQKICCYPYQSGFISASAGLIRAALDQAPEKTRVLFSAHGLPEKIIEGGDPYQHQCEQSAAKIAAAMGIENLDWQVCYQSRVGRLKWIGPSTEEALDKAAADGVGVIVYPHAFVNEHVETLVEIEEEYREYAHEKGIPYFARVPTVSTHPDFMTGLAALVENKINGMQTMRVCPDGFTRCGCKL